MAVIDQAIRTVRMLVASEDGSVVDTWEGLGRLGLPKPDGSYMTEDEVAAWYEEATGTRQTLRLCNHEDSCGLPGAGDLELVGGRIQAKPGAPPLDEYKPDTMTRQFLEFADGHVYRLEPGEWTPEIVAAKPDERQHDGLDHLGRPTDPRVEKGPP